MISPRDRHVVVCGGGIVGLSSALYLARAGCRVTLVERNAADADTCAHGSAGYVSPSHVAPIASPGMVWKGLKWMLSSRSPFYIKPRLDADLIRWGWLFAKNCTAEHTRRVAPVLRDLCLVGRELFVALAAETGNTFELQTVGLLNLCKTQQFLDYESGHLGDLANSLGVEARTLGARETAALEPGVRLDVAGCVYFPIDAHLTTRKFMPALTALVRAAGVETRFETEIRGWHTEGGRITAVETSAGRVAGDEFVLTGGSYSAEMLAGLRLRLPMQAGKGYSLTIPNPRLKLTRPAILTERRVAATPMGDTLRFGGTMEIAGINHRIRPERVQQIKDSVKMYLPDFDEADFAGVQPWCGLRPVSPDGMPYVGRFARHPNLIAACGHAMLGVTLAPVTGRLVTELVTGRAPCVSLDLLNPDRFA